MDEEGWPGRSCKGCGILNHLHDYATDAAKHDSQSDCEVDNWVIIAPTAFVIILLGTFAFVKYRQYRARQTRALGGELAAAQDKAVELANPLNRADFRVNPTNLTLGTEIARGGGGVVYRGTLGSAAVAVKEIIANMINAQDVAEFENEGKMVALFRHPNVLTGYGWCVKQDPHTGAERRYIVTELAAQGSLRDMLRAAVRACTSAQELPFDAVQAVRWALQIASGLRFVHDRGYMHRDVKPGNILLVGGVAKVADLGSARRDRSELASEERKAQMRAEQDQLEQLEQQYAEEAGAASTDVENNARRLASARRAGSQDMPTRMTRAQGTFQFMAPEMLNTGNYSKSIDVW
jgi:serine/threonine protein kinase